MTAELLPGEFLQLREALISEHAAARHGFRAAAEQQGPAPSVLRRTATRTSATCGDTITVFVDLDAAGAVSGLTWHGMGCAVSQASASVLASLVRDRRRSDVVALTEQFRGVLRNAEADPDDGNLGDAFAFAGIARYPLRERCASLAWDALAGALE